MVNAIKEEEMVDKAAFYEEFGAVVPVSNYFKKISNTFPDFVVLINVRSSKCESGSFITLMTFASLVLAQ